MEGPLTLGAPAILRLQLRARRWAVVEILVLGCAAALYVGLRPPFSCDPVGKPFSSARYCAHSAYQIRLAGFLGRYFEGGQRRRCWYSRLSRSGDRAPVPSTGAHGAGNQPPASGRETCLSFAFDLASSFPVGAIGRELVRERVPADPRSSAYPVSHSEA